MKTFMWWLFAAMFGIGFVGMIVAIVMLPFGDGFFWGKICASSFSLYIIGCKCHSAVEKMR